MAEPEFDRLGRRSASPLRQSMRQTLLGLLPNSRFTATAGRTFPARWTFDDGPSPEHTPRVLDVLAEHQIRAAFFMVGEQAEAHPRIVRQIVDAGHLLGSHSHTHPAPRSLSSGEYLLDFKRGREAIEDIAGIRVPCFRPPHGFLSAPVLIRMLLGDWQIVLWGVDPKDYELTDPARLQERLLAGNVTGNDVVLLHDTAQATAAGLGAFLRSTSHREGT